MPPYPNYHNPTPGRRRSLRGLHITDSICPARIVVRRNSSQRISFPAGFYRRSQTSNRRYSSRTIPDLSTDKERECTSTSLTQKSCSLPPTPQTTSSEEPSVRARKRQKTQQSSNRDCKTVETDTQPRENAGLGTNPSQTSTVNITHRNRKDSRIQRNGAEVPDVESSVPGNSHHVDTAKCTRGVRKLLGGRNTASESKTDTDLPQTTLRIFFSGNPRGGRRSLKAERRTALDSGIGDSTQPSSHTHTSKTGCGGRKPAKMKRKTAEEPEVGLDMSQTSTPHTPDPRYPRAISVSSYRERNRTSTSKSDFLPKSHLRIETSRTPDGRRSSKMESNRDNRYSKTPLDLFQTPTLQNTSPMYYRSDDKSDEASYDGLFGIDRDDEGSSWSLDSQVDEPSSISARNSMAARTSGRVRKPTAKAIEALQQRPKSRKQRAPLHQIRPPAGEGARIETAGENRKATPSATYTATAGDLCESVSPKWSHASISEEEFLAKQLYELASAALAPDFKSSSDGDLSIKRLRKEYHASRQATAPGGSIKGCFSSSDVTSAVNQTETTGTALNTGLPSLVDHLAVSRPWTDEDGWTHTGRVNEHGEEIALVPDTYVWIRPTKMYADGGLPQPPPHVKSREQIEKDEIFGFPPPMGQRNLPRGEARPFVAEDVGFETAKIKAREAAAKRGLTVDRSMSLAEIEAKIKCYDTPGSPKPKRCDLAVESGRQQNSAGSATGRSRKRRRAGGTNGVRESRKYPIEKSHGSNAVEDIMPKKRRISAPAHVERAELNPGIEENDKHGDTASTRDGQLPKQNRTDIGEVTRLGGRPRRRAAAAMLAQIQIHTETRARKASARKRRSNAACKSENDSQPTTETQAGGEAPSGHIVLATERSDST